MEQDLKVVIENNYQPFDMHSIDKHSKSVISKASGASSNLQHFNNLNILSTDQKRSFDFAHKRPNAAEGASRDLGSRHGIPAKEADHESYADKKTASSKWVLMNSKHLRNKSEAKIMGEPRGSLHNQGAFTQPQGPQADFKKDDRVSHNIGSAGAVERYACKSRQGFIPNMKKTN